MVYNWLILIVNEMQIVLVAVTLTNFTSPIILKIWPGHLKINVKVSVLISQTICDSSVIWRWGKENLFSISHSSYYYLKHLSMQYYWRSICFGFSVLRSNSTNLKVKNWVFNDVCFGFWELLLSSKSNL